MAKLRVISSLHVYTVHSSILNAHGYGHVTVLKFGRLPWWSTSRGFVSDSWATCWEMWMDRQPNK